MGSPVCRPGAIARAHRRRRGSVDRRLPRRGATRWVSSGQYALGAVTHEQQIAALREEIRRAGRNTGRTRRMLTGGLLVATVAIFAYGWVTLPRVYPEYPDLVHLECIVALGLGVGSS